MNPVPLTVRVIDAPPVTAVEGLIEASSGGADVMVNVAEPLPPEILIVAVPADASRFVGIVVLS